jgi:outer membrane protein TolC
MLLWVIVFQPCARAQRVLKFSPKVLEVLSTPPLELKDDDTQLDRLKKERFNAALNEAKARFDLYKRGLTKLPDLIEVGQRLFSAEVDLYDKPEDRARVLERHLDVYNEAEENLEKHVKEGLATQADLEQLRYNKASLEIDLLTTRNSISQQQPVPQPSPH